LAPALWHLDTADRDWFFHPAGLGAIDGGRRTHCRLLCDQDARTSGSNAESDWPGSQLSAMPAVCSTWRRFAPVHGGERRILRHRDGVAEQHKRWLLAATLHSQGVLIA